MYKIYINENRLILCSYQELRDIESQLNSPYTFRYNGKVKTLPNYIDRLEKRANFGDAIVYAEDYEKLINDFKSLYVGERAAGGLVVNKDDQFLIMFRRGFLDLPKGKIEKGESKKEAAIREIIEETGVKKIILKKKILKTRHTYKNAKKERIRKICHWYLCECNDENLVPQLEEDIEWAKWMTRSEIVESPLPIYKNVVDVIKAYLRN